MLEVHKRKNLVREIKILEKLNHKNVVKLYDAFESERQIQIVMEFIGTKSLEKFCNSKNYKKL